MTPIPPERRSVGPSDSTCRRRGRRTHTSAGTKSLLVLVSILSLPGAGEAQRLNIRNYTQTDGLPQIQVYSVHQDPQGYIWVGSNAGLARYDGRRFHSITSAQGLDNNAVILIDAFPSGDIVVATGSGVCFVQGMSASCVGISDGLVHEQIRDLHPEPNGDLWVAADDGVSLVRGGDRRVRTFGLEDGLPSDTVTAILRDAEGTVWAGTMDGLVRFNGTGWEPAPLQPASHARVLTLFRDEEGLLVGTDTGLFAREGDAFVPVALGRPTPFIRQVTREKDGTIWAVTPEGVIRKGPEGAEFYSRENGIPSLEIWDILVDRERNVWMGTSDGLVKLVPGAFVQFTDAQGLPHPFVRALTQTPDGRLWFGTRDGLAFWNGDGMEEVPFRDLVPDPRVYSLASDQNGGLLVGTSGGLVHRDPAGNLRLFSRGEGIPHGFVSGMIPDGEGGVWIATGRGVVRWADGGLHPPPDSLLLGYSVLSLARDPRDRLWVGMNSGGVLVLDGDSIRTMGAEDGLSDQTIWAMAADSSGGMWIGTNGDGAFRVSDDGIRHLTEEDGLGDGFVWQILTDGRGDVWFFTGRGLNRLTGNRLLYYGTGEGLQDLEGSAAAAMEDEDGSLWFGTGSGVYRYRPELDREPPPPARIHLESITVGGRQMPPSTRAFQPRPGVISFRFSAPTYRDEEGILYRYRLVGAQDDWSEPSYEPLVSFARLGYGEYTLQVQGETARGHRTPEVLSLPFRVRPAFYETLWFRGGMGLILVLGFLQVPNLRARHLESERKRLEGLVRNRTKEIRENARRLEEEIQERQEAERAREALESQLRQAQKMEAIGRLAGGIAHDFNNLLTSVLGYTELLAANADPDSELGRDLEEIKSSAQKGAALVSQLLAFSRQQIVQWQPLDVREAIEDTVGMISRVIGAPVRLELELSEKPLWVRGDPNQLGQVLLNLAVNARDAMPRGGRLLITARPQEVVDPLSAPLSDPVPPGSYVLVRVSDTGHGMDEETLRRAFEPFFTTKEVGKGTGLGLASVYGIVHQHQGFIQVSTTPGQGSTFGIYLPSVARGPVSDG